MGNLGDDQNTRELAELLAVLVNVPAGGRLELIFDNELRFVDGYVKPRNHRLTPKLLEELPADLLRRAQPG